MRLDGQLDHSYALMSLSQAQVLLDYTPDEITGVELKVQDPFAVRNMTYRYLYDYPQRLQVQDWIGKFGYMYNDIQLIRTVMCDGVGDRCCLF